MLQADRLLTAVKVVYASDKNAVKYDVCRAVTMACLTEVG